MSMLAEIGTYLEANTDLTLAEDLFIGQLPDSPDTAVALAQGPNGRPDFMLGAPDDGPHAPAFETYRLQVVCRSGHETLAYAQAEERCWELYRRLCLSNITISGVRYLAIDPVAVPAPLDEDKQGRITFVANFDVLRTSPQSGVAQ